MVPENQLYFCIQIVVLEGRPSDRNRQRQHRPDSRGLTMATLVALV